MGFKDAFLHSVTSQSGFPKDKNITDFLPEELSFSHEAAEHIIYLKCAGNINLPPQCAYTQKGFHSFLLIRSVSGSASLLTDDREYAIAPGSICFIDCYRKYSLHCIQPFSFDALFFDGYAIPYYYGLFPGEGSPVATLLENSILPGIFSKIIEENSVEIYKNGSSQSSIQKELINSELLTQILTRLSFLGTDKNLAASAPAYIMKIKNLMESSYEENLTLDRLAMTFGTNKYQICRDFKKYLNSSPLQYLNEVRIEHAKHLLTNTDLRINEIGWKIGIENTNHFIQLFKKSVGMTPTMYRKHNY